MLVVVAAALNITRRASPTEHAALSSTPDNTLPAVKENLPLFLGYIQLCTWLRNMVANNAHASSNIERATDQKFQNKISSGECSGLPEGQEFKFVSL